MHTLVYRANKMRSCLIIDGNETARLAIADAVRAAAKGVIDWHEAPDAASGARLFTERSPDIVFLDADLGSATTASDEARPAVRLDILRAMLEERPRASIVLMTDAKGPRPALADAITMGALAILRRPFKPEDVKFILDAMEPEKARMDYFS